MTKSREITKGQKIFVIMAVFVCGLLFYANGVAFNLVSAPTYIVDVIAFSALAVAVGLTVVTITIVIRAKRRILSARRQKSNVDSLVKLDQPSDTVSLPSDAQESLEKVDTSDQVIQNIQVPDEEASAVLPVAKSSRRRNLFAAIIAVVVGLLVYVNVVAFGLFVLPIFSMYVAAVGVAGLIGVVFVVALVEKRRDTSAKKHKANVVSAIKESNEPLETGPSTVDFQEDTNVVETDKTDYQIPNVSDEAQVVVLPKVKSSKKKNVLIFIIAISVSLFFLANSVAFGLIGLPGYFAYAFVASACALTIFTVAIALVAKRKGAIPKAPIVEVVGALEESNVMSETPDIVSSPPIAQTSEEKVEPDKVSIETVKVPDETSAPIAPPTKVFGKRNLFLLIIAFTVGLLFFANAVAFDLISLPDYYIYAGVTGAVALASISVAVILGGKIKVLGNRIKRFISEPQVPEIINEVKEPTQAPDIAPAPVIAQTTIREVDKYTELIRQFGVQNAPNKREAEKAEQKEQLPKKPVIPPTKVICPACRKEFSLAFYERDYIVNFGPQKKSNLIKQCPHCQNSISLKRIGVFDEEDIWKD